MRHCGQDNIVGLQWLSFDDAEAVWRCYRSPLSLPFQKFEEKVSGGSIIIAAIGRPDFVTADMVKPGAVVIDVGTARGSEMLRRKAVSATNGDVKFDEVAENVPSSLLLPGGVGPMTICSADGKKNTGCRQEGILQLKEDNYFRKKACLSHCILDFL